jgi:hypothetical protein
MENNDIILNKKNYLPINFNEKNKKTIYTLFINVIFEYLKSFNSIIKQKNKQYSISVIKKGISMLKNVMNVLFLYTRNIDMIHSHLNKSFLYYIEFIEQIGEEGNSFLQLSSKDAVLFVYKKTLFEINTDYKKNMTYTKEETKIINAILDTLNLFVFITEYVIFKNLTSLKDIDHENIYKKIIKIIDKYTKKQEITDLNEHISCLFYHLVLNNTDNLYTLSCIESFIHKITLENIKNFRNNITKLEIQSDVRPNKYINLLFAK